MRRLVIATGNAGKLYEIRTLLSPLGIEVLAQSAFSVRSVEETGHTFIENALLKARHAAERCGLPALADDSGLEVDALGGKPGIHSARFAGEDANDTANVNRLLGALEGVTESGRTARFHCVVALLRHPGDAIPIVCQGTWEGRITERRRGSGGFGYDPVFLDCKRGETAAEMPQWRKNRLSHRGKALRAMRAVLAAWTNLEQPRSSR